MTRIIFLGTGGDNYVISKCIRNSGGIVIQHDEMQFHIDPGPNSLLSAKNNGVNVRATTAIICTSPKISHSNDVNAVISAMTYNGMDVKGVLVATKTLIEGNEANHALLQRFFRDCIEKVIVCEPAKRIGIEQADIQFLETVDYSDSVGMKLYMPDMVIGYTSDTSYNEKIAKQYVGCDVLIVNVTNPFGIKVKYKMSTEDAIKLVNKVQPKLTILTHFGKLMLQEDPLQEARKVHAETGLQVMAAMDGQVVLPATYSAQSSQKSLKNF